MSERIVGYSLLTAGILIIFFAAFNVYLVFTKQLQPVELFDLPAPNINVGQLMAASLPQEYRGIVENSGGQEIIQKETINQPLNLYAHLFLMGFVVSVGFKIASLGVMLIRPVVVKLKEKQE